VIDFGLMDFVSSYQGAIPSTGMQSPMQFTHPLIVRAKGAIGTAAAAHGVIASHNVTRDVIGLNSSLGLKEAKDLVDACPATLLEKASKETADKAKAALEAAGATVTIK
jgi:hypothetical protein